MSGLRDELAALIRGWDQTTMSPHAAQLVLRDSADEVRALMAAQWGALSEAAA